SGSLGLLLSASAVIAQSPSPSPSMPPIPSPRQTGGGGGLQTRRSAPSTDTARAHELYVSKDPKDLPGCGAQCATQITNKARTDSIYAARSRGVMEFSKVRYKSRVDGLEIPAYLFAPITKSPQKHAALVWVHGGVHGDWGTGMFPFIREAVQRGYVIITPDYRGSTGFGDAYYKLIDY